MHPYAANAQAGGPWVYIIPLLIGGLVILRNSRARSLKVERLWIMPVILIALTALTFVAQPLPRPSAIALEVAALIVGVALGWWRGRLTHITVNPDTHDLTSKASPIGMLLILGIFALRYALRSFGGEAAGMLHVSVFEITDALMLLAVGIVCTQRLEMALRATRLVAEHRSA
jgi:hypothetical protein